MPNRRVSMRKIRDILRLKQENKLTNRHVAKSLSIAKSTVADHLVRARMAGIRWPLPDGMDDEAIERLLFPPPPLASVQRPMPDFADIHKDLKRKGVTLLLLWQEYKAHHPDGYQYTRFCDLYRAFQGKLSLSMRQVHVAGEKMFVDYCGLTVDVIDRTTGEVRKDGRYGKLTKAIGKAGLLILDDLGLDPMSTEHRRSMFEIIEERYGLLSPASCRWAIGTNRSAIRLLLTPSSTGWFTMPIR